VKATKLYLADMQLSCRIPAARLGEFLNLLRAHFGEYFGVFPDGAYYWLRLTTAMDPQRDPRELVDFLERNTQDRWTP